MARITERHYDRFVAEGALRTRYDREARRELVENATEFLRETVAPQGANWPPALPELDAGLEREFAASAGDAAETARRALEPFRFATLDGAWSDIVGLARPSVRLLPGADDEAGRTRIGGDPDLPAGSEWPHFFDDAPLGFVAQVSLADIQAVLPTSLVPPRGLLSFFYEPTQAAWGFDPKDRGRWAVVYSDEPLTRVTPPATLPDEGRYEPLPIAPMGELTLPEPDSLEVERLGLDDLGVKAYWALSAELEAAHSPNGEPVHRFLGWPEEIQHDPALEVQLPANGIYAGGPDAYRSEEGRRLMAQRDVWRLVLQLDSDERPKMMWGDSGRIYFLMTRNALAARKWDEAWFSLQCY